MNEFSKNLKYLRNINKLNQDDIAKIVKKDRSLISQWEADSKNATVEDIIKLSDYFNVPMDDLVGTDLALNSKPLDKREILFNKTKDILSDDDWATIEFIMNKTINNYEKNKNGE